MGQVITTTTTVTITTTTTTVTITITTTTTTTLVATLRIDFDYWRNFVSFFLLIKRQKKSRFLDAWHAHARVDPLGSHGIPAGIR